MSARRGTVAGLLIVTWLCATGALGTCSFFRPSSPEPPTGHTIFADYSTPTNALATIAAGIADKNRSNGQDVYVRAYAESTTDNRSDGRAYHGFFDLHDLVLHPNWDRARDWTREQEGSFYAWFVRRYVYPVEMTWKAYEPAGNESGGATDSLLHRQYRVVQVVRNVRVLIAAGAADLYFVKSPNVADRWVIARWQDYRPIEADSSQVTLGSLRLDSQ